MPKLLVTTHSGEELAIDATSGLSVMENIRDNGVKITVAQAD